MSNNTAATIHHFLFRFIGIDFYRLICGLTAQPLLSLLTSSPFHLPTLQVDNAMFHTAHIRTPCFLTRPSIRSLCLAQCIAQFSLVGRVAVAVGGHTNALRIKDVSGRHAVSSEEIIHATVAFGCIRERKMSIGPVLGDTLRMVCATDAYQSHIAELSFGVGTQALVKSVECRQIAVTITATTVKEHHDRAVPRQKLGGKCGFVGHFHRKLGDFLPYPDVFRMRSRGLVSFFVDARRENRRDAQQQSHGKQTTADAGRQQGKGPETTPRQYFFHTYWICVTA